LSKSDGNEAYIQVKTNCQIFGRILAELRKSNSSYMMVALLKLQRRFSMLKRSTLFILAILLIVAIPLVTVSARGTNPATKVVAAQEAAKCADKTFLEGLGKDLTDSGKALTELKMDDPVAVSQALLQMAVARQKYEDLSSVPAECLTTQLAAIIAFANMGDLLALTIAAKADPSNAETYVKAITAQAERATKTLQDIMTEAGLATPAAP
jgi:hypothetical protein